MVNCILLTMSLWNDDLKRFIVPEHGKDDITDLMHDGSNCHVLFLAGTFADIVIVNNRVGGCFCPFINLEIVQCNYMQDTPCKARTAFGHMDFITFKITRLLYGRIQAKIGIKLFGKGNRSKAPISAIRTTALRKPTPRSD